MAPFGRNFLKARMKSKSKETKETPEKEIQILVGKEEKVVSGVTKHTTCVDVVQALLEDQKTVPESKRLLYGEPKEFCLLERWKGFERALPPLTRILRLWNAWGDEKPFIQFVLIKTSEFFPKKVSKTKGLKSKRWEHSAGQYSRNIPVERQKRLVKKAFRKLEKIQKAGSLEGSEEIDQMVQLIISQDYTIRQQLHHIREMDLELELVEQQLSEICLPDSSITESANSQHSLSIFQCEDQLQEYLFTSDGIAQMELQVLRHQELIDNLSKDIDFELRKAVCTLDTEELMGAAAPNPDLDLNPISALTTAESLELDTLHYDLEESMRAGISLHTQIQDLEKELQRNTTMLQSRSQEYQHLIAQLSSMQLEDTVEPSNPVYPNSPVRPGVSQKITVSLRSKHSPSDVTDTDSDTGISSTHSQDSLSPCVDRQPTLDTDV